MILAARVFAFIAGRASLAARNSALILLTTMLGALALPAQAFAVDVAPSVTTQPVNTTVVEGNNATFTAAASGSPSPSVKWQTSPDGITFTDYPGATSTSFTLNTVNRSANGTKVKAIFTNVAGTATTNIVTLTVHYAPSVTTDPVFESVNAGSNATFTAAASGNPTPTVQWQVSTNGGSTYSNIVGATSTTLTFATVAGDNGKYYRAVFTNVVATDTSNGALLQVLSAPNVTTDPSDTTKAVGQSATFTAAATGVLTPAVQWQVSTNGGSTFTNIPGANLTTLTVSNVQASQNGYKYQAVFTNASGSDTSASATLTVTSIAGVATSPSDLTVAAGATASFTATGSGNPAPTVQWQVSTNGGATFTNIPSATSTTLSFTAALADNGNRYRAVFTNTSGSSNSADATLTVTQAPSITGNPANTSVNEELNATFTASASGSPAPTVQWQSSPDGTTFTDIPGATFPTLVVHNVQPSQNGWRYRANFTNTGGTAQTTAATLTVNYGPDIVTNPTNQTVNAGSTATFTASASGNPAPTVQWQVSTNGGISFADIPGATTTTLSFTALASQHGNRYRAVFTNSVGSVTTTAASLSVVVVTSTSLSASTLAALLGEPVTFTATVTPAAAPGSVTFLEGITELCSNVALVAGTATCTTSFTTAGSHSVTARYNGSGIYAMSTSAAVTVVVTDQRFMTVQAIGNFLSLRGDMLLSNAFDGGRQIDRLLEEEQRKGGSGFASEATPFGAAQTRSGTTSFGGSVGFAGMGGLIGAGVRSSLDELLVRSGADASDATVSHGFFSTLGSLRGGTSDNGAINVSFATSLREILRYSEANDALGARETQRTMRGPLASRFDIWVEGHYAEFNDDRGGSDSDGHFGVIYLGADYIAEPWLLLGIVAQYDDMTQESNALNTRTTGRGWLAGPYATARLSQNLFLQGRAAWGMSSNDVSPFMTYVDRFDTERWLVSSTLTGSWTDGHWQFRPAASLAYVEETSESYRDTFHVLIPEVSTSLGQFKAEPEVSYLHTTSDGVLIEPRLKASAIWNFESTGTASAFGGTLVGPEEMRGKIEAGVGVRLTDGVSFDLSGSYDGIGSSTYDSSAVALSARVPLN